MFLLKLVSKLQNLVKKLPCAMKILANYRLHFHEVEYFHRVECTGGPGHSSAEQGIWF